MSLTLTTPEITENMPVHKLLYRIHVYGRPFFALYSLNSNHTTPLALGQINDERASTTGTLNRPGFWSVFICTVRGVFSRKMSSAWTDHLSRFLNSDTFTAEGHKRMMGWMNEHVHRFWKIYPGGTDLWKEVYKNTKSGQRAVAWKQMIQLSGKYIIYVNKAIITIAAVKVFSDKRSFFFHIQFVRESKAYGVSDDQVFPCDLARKQSGYNLHVLNWKQCV